MEHHRTPPSAAPETAFAAPVEDLHAPLWRRAGQAAFWFFLLKGLAWLIAPVAAYFWF